MPSLRRKTKLIYIYWSFGGKGKGRGKGHGEGVGEREEEQIRDTGMDTGRGTGTGTGTGKKKREQIRDRGRGVCLPVRLPVIFNNPCLICGRSIEPGTFSYGPFSRVLIWRVELSPYEHPTSQKCPNEHTCVSTLTKSRIMSSKSQLWRGASVHNSMTYIVVT